ncbi:glutathione S-transferase 1-1-like [Daphnia carinata]|uniref:glutathione S-transferase 1-1-like n=1 Tax=Daphnia carinata TaxID=120202 RepID=UPI00257A51DB|nr:glutathione S-transferase 1-1-like [Daphnia carinata]
MPIDLYYTSLSPPCRSVMMTAYMAGVDVNLKMLNLMNRDQLKPEFLKINPQHNVPTIVDEDGFCLNESQAICMYLINRYGGHKAQHLYPEEAQQRAVIDQLLNFGSSVLFANARDLFIPVVMHGAKQLDPAALKNFHDGIGFVDIRLADSAYAAGQHLTIADIALVASISSIDAVDSRILDKYSHIQTWLKRCQKEIAHYEELNGNGAKLYGQFVKNALEKIDVAESLYTGKFDV